MVNPFGEEADSVFAWKERYKQADYERNLLKQRVSEIKEEIEQIKKEYDDLANQNAKLNSELTRVTTELRQTMVSLRDKESEVEAFSKALNLPSNDKLAAENAQLKQMLKEYQASSTRGESEKETPSIGIMEAVVPVMMKFFDPENKRYDNAFMNLINAAILQGGTIEKIIGNLIKLNGSVSRDKLEQLVAVPSEFDVALDILKEEKIIKEVQNTVYLINLQQAPALSDSWENKEIPELFEMMKKVIRSEPPKVVVDSIMKFRDALQEKEIPMTMMFQIRKLSERIEKSDISREEAIEQVEEWETKVVN